MNITLGKIESPKFYIDVAFRKASEKARRASPSIRGSRLEKAKTLELIRLESVKDNLSNSLEKIARAFPRFDELSEFYKELIKCFVDYVQFKRSLAFLKWTKKKILVFYKDYSAKIKKGEKISKIKEHRIVFYGRISSLLKKLKKDLEFLEFTRKTLKEFPVVRNMFTVCITGFPNVGKTTLLSKMTLSKPEIAPYPFTTKRLNIGYFDKIQVIDAPGTLNRFNKMNWIEQQAFLAMKYSADLIIYIFDLTEPYPLNEQFNLFENIKKLNKPTIIYLSKSDIIEKDLIENFAMQHSGIHDIEMLKKAIIDASKV